MLPTCPHCGQAVGSLGLARHRTACWERVREIRMLTEDCRRPGLKDIAMKVFCEHPRWRVAVIMNEAKERWSVVNAARLMKAAKTR